jgi:hypothetical protein
MNKKNHQGRVLQLVKYRHLELQAKKRSCKEYYEEHTEI